MHTVAWAGGSIYVNHNVTIGTLNLQNTDTSQYLYIASNSQLNISRAFNWNSGMVTTARSQVGGQLNLLPASVNNFTGNSNSFFNITVTNFGFVNYPSGSLYLNSNFQFINDLGILYFVFLSNRWNFLCVRIQQSSS